MIVEERVYTLHPGKLADYYRIYEERGLPIQRRILGRLIGFFHSEIGTLNQVVHLWAYDDLSDRERRRAELVADATWQEYLKLAQPLFQRMESRILVPAPFSPIK